MKNYQVSSSRQVAYYIGMAVMILGLLLFLSTFLLFFTPQKIFDSTRVGNQDSCYTTSSSFNPPQLREMLKVPECGSFEHQYGKYFNNPLARAIGGGVLFWLGAFLMLLGKAGLRGSGVILDPQGARQDLEPFNRASGGMVQDALEEIPALGQLGQTVIKVKCRSCSALNPENAKFCNQCGQVL